MILFTTLPLNSIYVIFFFFLFLSRSKMFPYHYSMCEVLIWGLQQVQNEFEELRL